MKKLVLSFAIISAFGLSACNNETIEDVKKEIDKSGSAVTPTARVIFDPAKGILSIPNDLLFSGSVDGTLNLPVTDPTDYSDPTVAMSALDGWSTTNPFVLAINFPSGTSLDASSVVNPASVKIFEALMGGDPGCEDVPRGAGCSVVSELTFGVDFVTQASGNNVAVVPLKPFKAKTSYILALTNNLKDNNGKAVGGSITYDLVRQDFNTHPLATEAQKGLQAVINSYENAIVTAGADKDTLIYTMALTTQSTIDVLATVKALMASNVPAMVENATKGIPAIGVQDTGMSVAQILNADPINPQIPPSLVPLYSAANFMQGSITLPYYLGVSTPENPLTATNAWWDGLCDSGAILAGVAAKIAAGELPSETIPVEAISVEDGTCMAISAANQLPAPGLRALGFDEDRYLTKFNPVPKANANMSVVVQMTTPDVNIANAVRASLGIQGALAEPDNGWPVVILQHGITSKKEDMLALTGILSTYGFATVAINHPLHGDSNVFGGLLPGGSRGFDINGDGIDDINASTVSATHYMNLSSLLTTRDNLRQSTADLIGLRLGLNFLGGVHAEGNQIKVDSSNVHFLGHSLGAITGVNFVALANTALAPTVDPLFSLKTNSLAMPGSMIANFLMESGAFGDIVKSGIAIAGHEGFQGYVAQAHEGTMTPTETELISYFNSYLDVIATDTNKAELSAMFAQFTFAAQTVTDSADPANYATMMAATQTPTHLVEVVGNGVDTVEGGSCTDIALTDNCSDQVIPNRITTSPIGGTEGVIALLGLPNVSTTTQGSGAVRFVYGHHGSILTPSAIPGVSPDAEKSDLATKEMQAQAVGFFASMGQLIIVADTEEGNSLVN